jgi:hypothetical protein
MGSRSLLMRADAGAVEERHPELPPDMLSKPQQAFPDTKASPTDEGLRGARPGTKLSRDGAPLGPVLMPPEDGRDRAAQILRRRLAPRPARVVPPLVV